MTDMIDRPHTLSVGVVYGEYFPLPQYCEESVSEMGGEVLAHAVLREITGLGFPAFLLPVGIDLLRFLNWLWDIRVDLIVNLCESFRGVPQLEANVAGLFELLGIPFTGNSSKTLTFCQDKHRAKSVMAAWGLETPRGRLVDSPEGNIELDFPVIAKPNCEDASLGIGPDAVCWNPESLKRRIRHLLDTYHHPVLVEVFIPGREFNVAVLDRDGPEALPVSEILFKGRAAEDVNICSYEAKWLEDHELYRATPPLCPALVPDGLREQMQRMAVAAFQALECRDYARVDFRMNPDGRLFILEVNPNPDISSGAGFSRALKAAGIPYREFLRILIRNSLSRRESDGETHVYIRHSPFKRNGEEDRKFFVERGRGGGRTDGGLHKGGRPKRL